MIIACVSEGLDNDRRFKEQLNKLNGKWEGIRRYLGASARKQVYLRAKGQSQGDREQLAQASNTDRSGIYKLMEDLRSQFGL